MVTRHVPRASVKRMLLPFIRNGVQRHLHRQSARRTGHGAISRPGISAFIAITIQALTAGIIGRQFLFS